MKIYLAGKIAKNDWRHDIVNDLRGAGDVHSEIESYNLGDKCWPILRQSILGKHDYVGPYFVACDHGCYHGDSSHGVGVGEDVRERIEYAKQWSEYEAHGYPVGIDDQGFYVDLPGGSGCGTSLDAGVTVDLCNKAIGFCDLLFAWIQSPDCYGTLAEIGYAKALGKKIWIAGAERFPDLWFAYTLADKTLFNVHGAADALCKMFGDRPVNYREYILSAAWREKAEAAKERAGQRCQVCNRPRGEVMLDAHHRTYDRLGNEAPEDITVLCRDCHSLYEANKRAKKVQP